MKWHSWFIVGLLTGAFIAVDLIATWSWHATVARDHQFLFAAIIGASVAQVNMIAIWAALAPGRVLLRLPWSIFLATMMWYAIIIGGRTAEFWAGQTRGYYIWSLDMRDAVMLGATIFIGVVVVQVPLWVMSRWFGWRLSPPILDDAAGRDLEQQFNLKHLIAGTVLASVALGLGRVILPTENWGMPTIDRELPIIIPAVLLVNLIAVVPCIWIAFVRPPVMAALLFAWLVWSIFTSIMQVGTLSAMLGPPPDDVWLTFIWFNVVQGLCVLAALLVLRGAGFRLQRVGANQKIPASAMTAKPASDIMQPEPLTVTPAIPPAEQPP
jgi:hypothetical protein